MNPACMYYICSHDFEAKNSTKPNSKASKIKAKRTDKSGKKKRASFKRGSKRARLMHVSGTAKKARSSSGSTAAAASTRAPSEDEDERELEVPEPAEEPEFKGYSLRGFPSESLPDWTLPHNGAYSYTKQIYMNGDSNPAGTVDVLLKKGAFYVKKPAPGGAKGTIAFKKSGGPAQAWQKAMIMGGFVVAN